MKYVSAAALMHTMAAARSERVDASGAQYSDWNSTCRLLDCCRNSARRTAVVAGKGVEEDARAAP